MRVHSIYKIYNFCSQFSEPKKAIGENSSPSDGSAEEKTEGKEEGWTDWVSSLLMFQKMTEKVNYTISVKATALFATIQWSNHLRNPTSPKFEHLASELENALDQVRFRVHSPNFQISEMLDF